MALEKIKEMEEKALDFLGNEEVRMTKYSCRGAQEVGRG